MVIILPLFRNRQLIIIIPNHSGRTVGELESSPEIVMPHADEWCRVTARVIAGPLEDGYFRSTSTRSDIANPKLLCEFEKVYRNHTKEWYGMPLRMRQLLAHSDLYYTFYSTVLRLRAQVLY